MKSLFTVRTPAVRGKAFTLVELLTVVAIVGILASLILPVVGRMRGQADSSRCLSNLRQIGAACQLYIGENENRLPALGEDTTWYFTVAPYVQNGNTNSAALSPVFSCPTFLKETRGQFSSTAWDRHGYGMSTVMVGSPQTGWGWQVPPNTIRTYQPRVTDIREPARTILVSETLGPGWNWHSQNVQTFLDRTGPRGPRRHNGTINALFVDGHIQSVTPDALRSFLP